MGDAEEILKNHGLNAQEPKILLADIFEDCCLQSVLDI